MGPIDAVRNTLLTASSRGRPAPAEVPEPGHEAALPGHLRKLWALARLPRAHGRHDGDVDPPVTNVRFLGAGMSGGSLS